MIFDENFQYRHESCFQCNGFYATNFGQPVCLVCHAFLFPFDISHDLPSGQFPEKVDDGDSGNEEPKDHSDYLQQRQQNNRSSFNQALPSFPQFDVPSTSSTGSGANIGSTNGACGETLGGTGKEGDVDDSTWCSNGIQHRNPCSLLQRNLNLITVPRPPDDLNTLDPTVIDNIPSEVWFYVFSFLDDVTLWLASRVCKRWETLVKSYAPENKWKDFIYQRWPLYKPLCATNSWTNVYTRLCESAPCLLCLRQSKFQNNTLTNENKNSWRRNRLKNELRTLETDPPEGIAAKPLDKMSLNWQASIRGPSGSPYAGGTFFLFIQIPPTYPLSPPIVRFITRIFHPNVSRHGDIGIDSIQHNWSLALTLSKVLISIQSLLTDPYTKVCMEPEIGKLYENDNSEFKKIAKAWTWKYAFQDALMC